MLSVAAAPLSLGAVHRPALIALSAPLLACVVILAGLATRGELDGQTSVKDLLAPWGALVVLTTLQLVPLPFGARAYLDPSGTRLLERGLPETSSLWPLSLDPPATSMELLKAAQGLAVAFTSALLAAAHRRAGRAIVVAVALSGLSALTIGIGHHLAGLAQIYGSFATPSPTLIGPFVNPNHTAELLELAGFASFALGVNRQGSVRAIWFSLAALLVAGALATLSRGSLLALCAGGTLFLLLARSKSRGTTPPSPFLHRAFFVMAALLSVAGIAMALGAGTLLDEVLTTDAASVSTKTAVWADCLQIVARHPFGLGRGAFRHVYPTFKSEIGTAEFHYVENLVLQLLVDFGVVGTTIVAASVILVVRRLKRSWRGDAHSAALLAAIGAVLAHNLVDFGLEIPGIRLPVAALFGVVAGRASNPDRDSRAAIGRRFWTVAPAATLVLAVALASAPSTRDFDRIIRVSPSGRVRREVAIAAARAHPLDYYYPLVLSQEESLRSLAGGPSPRLAALARATTLCPICPEPRAQTARALEQLGRSGQALLEWKESVRLGPERLLSTAQALERAKRSPDDIAQLPIATAEQGLSLARLLAAKKAVAATEVVLRRARELGASEQDLALIRADLAIARGILDDARRMLVTQRASSPSDVRVYERLAALEEAAAKPSSALEATRAGLAIDPTNLGLARSFARLTRQQGDRIEFESALRILRAACQANHAYVGEAYLLAAEAFTQWGDHPRAAKEYRAALGLEPNAGNLWYLLGRSQEQSGDFRGALQSYQTARRLSPGHAEAGTRMEALRRAQIMMELQGPQSP